LRFVYGDVINRTGTGEVPYTGVLEALLPHPATFITVTFMVPVVPVPLALLMKTCKKPTTVTRVVLKRVSVVLWS
jgi:hypothetical protein